MIKDRINHYAKLLGEQKDVRYYDYVPRKERSIPGILLHAWLSGKPESVITIMQVGPGNYLCDGCRAHNARQGKALRKGRRGF